MHWMQDSTNWSCQEASEQGRAGQGRAISLGMAAVRVPCF